MSEFLAILTDNGLWRGLALTLASGDWWFRLKLAWPRNMWDSGRGRDGVVPPIPGSRLATTKTGEIVRCSDEIAEVGLSGISSGIVSITIVEDIDNW